MSLSEQISRVVGGHNGALRELLKQLGADVPDSEKADYFPSAAASIGNRLKPSSLLSDSTKSLYGLPSTSTPDNVLSWIGKYNTHWWSELHGEAGIRYDEVRTNIASGESSHAWVTGGGTAGTFICSSSVSIDQSTGAITQDSPTTVTTSEVSMDWRNETASKNAAIAEINKVLSLAPVYVKGLHFEPNTIFYFPVGSNAAFKYSDATIELDTPDDETSWGVLLGAGPGVVRAQRVSSTKVNVPAGETVYVNSTKRKAYPDNGTKNGLTYRYLGNPFENSVKSISIERGQYVGTGLYGESNPSSITFKRIPQLLFIHTTGYLLDKDVFVDCTKIADGTTYTSIPCLYDARFSGNTLYWYSSSASSQLNSSQVLYYYTSIY